MDTIKSSDEISDLFSQGRRIHSSYVTFIVGEDNMVGDNISITQHGHSGRVAFIAGKKQGNAVWRNKAKRRMRALCHDLGGPWSDSKVVFLAKRPLTQVSYQKALKSCQIALSKGGFSISGDHMHE